MQSHWAACFDGLRLTPYQLQAHQAALFFKIPNCRFCGHWCPMEIERKKKKNAFNSSECLSEHARACCNIQMSSSPWAPHSQSWNRSPHKLFLLCTLQFFLVAWVLVSLLNSSLLLRCLKWVLKLPYEPIEFFQFKCIFSTPILPIHINTVNAGEGKIHKLMVRYWAIFFLEKNAVKVQAVLTNKVCRHK